MPPKNFFEVSVIGGDGDVTLRTIRGDSVDTYEESNTGVLVYISGRTFDVDLTLDEFETLLEGKK